MPKKAATKYSVPALDRGMEVMEYLATQTAPRSQSEIAQGIGRGPNEIYRVLVSLENRGYLVRDEFSGKYHLSLKLYSLTRSISPIHHMRQCSMPHMDELAVKIGLRCHLSMLYESQAMIIVEARSLGPLALTMSEGSVFSTLSTASGRILLANSRPEVQTMILERDKTYQNLTTTKRKALSQKLEQIREEKYEISESEIAQGVTEYAALIGAPDGIVIAALSVSSLSSTTVKPVERKRLIAAVQKTAAAITKQLGC